MIVDPHHPDSAVARRALPLLDLTDLGDSCSDQAITTLCGKARASHVAAVCVWPQHIGRCVELLAGTPVRIATVINFPAGKEVFSNDVVFTPDVTTPASA